MRYSSLLGLSSSSTKSDPRQPTSCTEPPRARDLIMRLDISQLPDSHFDRPYLPRACDTFYKRIEKLEADINRLDKQLQKMLFTGEQILLLAENTRPV